MASDIPTSAALASSLKARSAHTTLSLTPSPNSASSSPYHPPSAYPHQYHQQYHHHSPYPYRPAAPYPLPLMDKGDRRDESRYIKQEEPPHERISSPASPSPSASTPTSPHPPSHPHPHPPSSSSSSGADSEPSEPIAPTSTKPISSSVSGHFPYLNDSLNFRQNSSNFATQKSPLHSVSDTPSSDHTPNGHYPDTADAMDKYDTGSDVAMEEADETRQRDDDHPPSANSNKSNNTNSYRSCTPNSTYSNSNNDNNNSNSSNNNNNDDSNNNHSSSNISNSSNKPNHEISSNRGRLTPPDGSPNIKRHREDSSDLMHAESGTQLTDDDREGHPEHDHDLGDQEIDADNMQSDRSERGWTASPGPKTGRSSSVSSSNGGAGSPRPRKNSVSHAKKEGRLGVTATSCANCGTTTTPLWRRASNGQTICNACGLYYKARNLTRPPWLKRNMGLKRGEHAGDTDGKAKTESSDNESGPSSNTAKAAADGSRSSPSANGAPTTTTAATNDDEGGKSECSGSCPGDGNCNGTGGSSSCAGCPSLNQANRQHLVCANCRTTTTPLWRRDSSGNTICNACGLYFKLHNVHRPVTMKRAVIKRRKRVNLVNTSPPLVPQQAMAQQGNASGSNSNGGGKNNGGAQSSSPSLPDEADPNDLHGHTATKRRRLQSAAGPNGTGAAGGPPGRVPNIEDYITPKRTANGQTEWIRRDPHDRRRSMSPIENIGSAHHEDGQHRMGDRYGMQHNQSYQQHHHQQGQQQQPPPQHAPSRYLYNPMMTMSRYPMHPPPPPRVSSGPPPSPQHHSQQHQPPPQGPQQQQPPQSPHHHPFHHQHSSPHHSHPPHGMQGGYQPPLAPRMGDMDDGMHSQQSPYSSYASGWNHRLPGYSTVSSSAFNTRLSSTGIVRSSGPGPGSPPLYPRQGPPPPNHQSYQYYRSPGHSQPPPTPPSNSGPSQGRGFHRSVSPVPQGPPPPSPGHYGSGAPPTQGTPVSAAPPGGYSSSYHHHQLPPIVTGPGNGHSPGPSGSGPPSHHLPPISIPPSSHHVPLPRPSDIVHGEHHLHPPTSQQQQQQGPPQQQQQQTPPSHYQHHQRRPSSPNGPPPPSASSSSSSSTLAALSNGGPLPSAEMLQQTRQEIQREVSHLSMLLGRAAAVLSGLDQALGNATAANGAHPSAQSNGGSGPNGIVGGPGQPPNNNGGGNNGASPPMHSSTVIREAGSPGNPSLSLPPPPQVANGPSVDPKTSSALASLMALSASGGPPPSYGGRPPMSHDDHGVDQGQQPPQPPQPSSQQQQSQVPPPQHHMPPRIHQGMPYPLPRRRDRDD
ncbi:putative electron transfer flavoprotein subunit [Actinomortierella ambigua]|nr:putative electron transfer flavoprotein subunit [Actinomortierella ambigua]